MTRALPAEGAGQGCVCWLTGILVEMTPGKGRAVPAGRGQGGFRSATEGAPQPVSQRALSGAEPKAPGATHPVLQRDVPSRAARAGCQELGRELVTCHQRG